MVYFCDGCGYQEDIPQEAKTPVARKKTTKAKDKEALKDSDWNRYG